MTDVCMLCGEQFNTDEVHAVEGMLFCSKACALGHKVFIGADMAEAAQWYEDYAEIVNPVDIGIETKYSCKISDDGQVYCKDIERRATHE